MIGAKQPTLAEVVWQAGDGRRVLRTAVLALAGSLFVAACAQVQIPLWPVPITGQTFAVLLVGLVFGTRLGAATVALYLLEGVLGLPVFADFSAGPGVIAGPTGGYIVGFVFAAGVVGWLAEKGWDRRPLSTVLAMILGNLVIYLFGLPWLTAFYAGPGAAYIASTGAEGPLGAAFAAGLVPFLVGDALKIALAAGLLPLVWRTIERRT